MNDSVRDFGKGKLLFKSKGFDKADKAHNKKIEVAKKMTQHELTKKNNETALEIDKHNKSWNGKRYTK